MNLYDIGNSLEWCLSDYCDDLQINYDLKILAVNLSIRIVVNGEEYTQILTVSQFIRSKDFYKCAKDLCEINTYDILRYIQKEIWLGGEVGEPDYQRTMQIIRNCLCYTADNFGAYPCESDVTLEDFRNMGLTDEEIEYFGWEYLFDVEEEE